MDLQNPFLNARPRTRQNRQSGFNLIEVMVALGILAFGILAIASMQETSLRTTGKAYNLTDGTSVAMDAMEDLIAKAYNDNDLDRTVNGDYELWPDDPPDRFTIDYAVTTDADDPNLPSGCKEIRVRVTWTDAGGGSRSTELVCTKQRI